MLKICDHTRQHAYPKDTLLTSSMDVPDAITEMAKRNGVAPKVRSPGENSRLLESRRLNHHASIFFKWIRCALGVLNVEEVEGVRFEVQYQYVQKK